MYNDRYGCIVSFFPQVWCQYCSIAFNSLYNNVAIAITVLIIFPFLFFPISSPGGSNYGYSQISVHPWSLLNCCGGAHFLPCHLAVMLIFSVTYTSFVPPETLHPTLVRAFSLANLIRTLSFIGMSINLAIYDQWHQI